MADSLHPENGNVTEAEQTAEQEPENFGKQFLFDLLDILQAGITAIFVFVLAYAYIMQPVNVDGSSMIPTLYDTDRLVMEKLFLQPKDGRIVIISDDRAGHFSDSGNSSVYETSGLNMVLVKRVIATAGEEIRIDSDAGEVYVNGRQLEEPYIAEKTRRDDGAFTYPFTVPEGYIFVMGDNRMHSTDSRNPGVALVPEDQVLGVAVMRVERNKDMCTKWTDNFDWLLF